MTLTPGERHESTEFESLMKSGPQCGARGMRVSAKTSAWPDAVAGDKAYSSNEIRGWCSRRDIEPVIPTRSNETPHEEFDAEKYRRRNIVERCVGWLKECRRVMTRFEKYAIHYAAMVTLAIIQRCLAELTA